MTTAGFVDGWAFDEIDMLTPIDVAVFAAGGEVARGTANLYRADLADAGRGTGWCGFRLRLSMPAVELAYAPLCLREADSMHDIAAANAVAMVDDAKRVLNSLDEILKDDTTLVHDIDQLKGCEALFSSIIATQGVETFMRISYNYLLDAEASWSNSDLYANRLRRGRLSPLAFLKALAESEAFQSAPRLLAAPSEPGFPFRLT